VGTRRCCHADISALDHAAKSPGRSTNVTAVSCVARRLHHRVTLLRFNHHRHILENARIMEEFDRVDSLKRRQGQQ
jgi:hypothetical protein